MNKQIYKNDVVQVEWSYEKKVQEWLPKYKIFFKSTITNRVDDNGKDNEENNPTGKDNTQNTSTDSGVHQQDHSGQEEQNEIEDEYEENESDHHNCYEDIDETEYINKTRKRHRSPSCEYEPQEARQSRLSRKDIFDMEQRNQHRPLHGQNYAVHPRKRSRSPSRYYDRDYDEDTYENYYNDYYDYYPESDRYDHNMGYDKNDEYYRSHVNVYPRRETEIDSNGVTWHYFDSRIHVRKDNNKIEVLDPKGSHTVDVRYRIGNPMQFQTIGKTKNSEKSPYIDAREGHAVLVSSFDRSISNNDLGNSKYIGIESSLTAGSGLSETLNIIKDNDSTFTRTLLQPNNKDITDSFPKSAFDAVSIVDFTAGWNFTNSSSFAAFAKDKDIDISAFLERIGAPPCPESRWKFLRKREREARRAMILSFTPLHLLDLMGEKIEKIEEHVKNKSNISSKQTNAIARTMLPVSRHLIGNWMTHKMNLRNAVLQDRSHPKCMKLLYSSLWEAGLCAEDAIKEAENSTSTNLPALLGLTNSRYPKSNRHNIQPFKKRRVEQPRLVESHYDYQYNTRGRGFRRPPTRKPRQISLPRRGQRNWQSHPSSKVNENQEQKSDGIQERNSNNFNKGRNTRNNRRGSHRK